MIETTADARRRGLYNPDFYINETNKHMFPPIVEDSLRKECKPLNKSLRIFIVLFYS